MSVTSHLAKLRQKHQELDRRIESEQLSPGSDDLTIVALKRQKLHLKEEITRLAETA
ncbi:MAG: YdcH family protein [Pseudomonadota bacterium]